jgi:Uma2 family endonuclease
MKNGRFLSPSNLLQWNQPQVTRPGAKDMVKTNATLMTLEQFMERYSDEGPFEFIEGEIVRVTPQVAQSGMAAGELLLALTLYLKSKPLGRAFSEVSFVLTHDTDWVAGSRQPDVMFVAADKLAHLSENDPEWRRKPLVVVPDLVAEVVSPTDRHQDVARKVERYLQDGVRVVWLIDPSTQTVTVYVAGSDQLTYLRAADMLGGGEIIPGFSLRVGDLFV